MDKLMIEGPCKLLGEVEVSKSKNSCLPILASVLMNPCKVVLREIPDLRDIQTMLKLLESLGVEIERQDDKTQLKAANINSFEATYELVKTMRASILVLGPLLARFGRAKVSLPGGCAIGTRPIDIHLKGLEKFGASIELKGGYVEARAERLKGAHVVLPFPSVGATEHLMMVACMADGESVIENAAREPEINDLANFLNAMGASVEGAGNSEIRVKGPCQFHSIDYTPIPDRIEAATYIIAGIMTRSNILIKKMNPTHIESLLEIFKQMGVSLEVGQDWIKVMDFDELKGVKVDTAPFPGFPTDIQAQLLALTTTASTSSVITEHIFENRFMHVPELQRMGADIILRGSSAIMNGSSKLTGAPVMCTDLRASAALVIAALGARGTTEIRRIYHLERGYEKLEGKLRKLGAKIRRVAD